MKTKLAKYRNRIYYQVWQDYKNDLTMEELAVVLNCPLFSYYRIIKKEQIKKYEKPYNPNKS